MRLKLLTSRVNPGWRRVLALAGSARERRRESLAVIEGIHLVQALFDAGQALQTLIVAEGASGDSQVQAIIAACERVVTTNPDAGIHAWQVPDAWFRELSGLEQGATVAAVVAVAPTALPATLEGDSVYLDRLQDPGNMGTILRTCAAVGVRTVITAPATTECWSPKALRAAMGAHFALDIHEGVAWSAVAAATAAAQPGMRLRATAMQAPHDLFASDLRGPTVWLFGNEGGGLDPRIVSSGIDLLSIPQSAAVESLNVATSAAVCLYEQFRQRRVAGHEPP